jgi:ankyrin repeat protein
MKLAKLLCLFLAIMFFADGCGKKPGGAVTPLHCAAEQGDIEQVQLLIANGADINSRDQYGQTPLERAAFAGHIKVVELLIAKGAEVNTKNQSGRTPLHVSALRGYRDIAQSLIATGADIEARARLPCTWRLHLAGRTS